MLTKIGYINAYWIWVFLTVLFTVIEVFTFGLVTVWFALASFIMIFLAFIPKFPFMYQIMVFLALSAVILIYTRPIAIKKFKMGRVKTNVESLVGMNALVTKKIGEFDKGEVKLNGQIWSAHSEDGSIIEEGTKCEVVRIEGVHAIVKKN
jgi:membrane protein implicated in regulation of membrane protease activity|nr:NfeD family protein [Treponema sp.]